MSTLVITPFHSYGRFPPESPTHKGHPLQSSRSPVNNTNHRRNSTNTHSPKAVSPPHRQQEPVTQSCTRSSGNTDSNRKLERAMSEPADRRTASSQSNSSRYKTELCRPFEENGTCKYGDKCQFAHGMKELRNLARHPKYKTELCRSFHSTGLCPYGPRCHFIHNSDQSKVNMYSTLGNQDAPPSRPKSLSSSSSGSSMDDISAPSSTGSSPTLVDTSDDIFQYPPTAFSFNLSPSSGMQRSYLDTPAFSPDIYDNPCILDDRIISSVFGSCAADILDLESPIHAGTNAKMELLFRSPNDSPPYDSSPGFSPFPVFNLFGKQELQIM